jgi:hypothetical protein
MPTSLLSLSPSISSKSTVPLFDPSKKSAQDVRSSEHVRNHDSTHANLRYVLAHLIPLTAFWHCPENLAATHDFRPTPQFILSYFHHDESWSVEVGHSWNFNPAAGSGETLLVGQGKTPELAYQDLLKESAVMVSNRDYRFDHRKMTYWTQWQVGTLLMSVSIEPFNWYLS